MNDAFGSKFRIFVFVALGALGMVALPAALEAVAAPGVPSMWWAARATGLLAYLSLWFSVLFGIFVSSRGAGGWLDRATVLELHNRWAVAALVVTVLHVLAAIGDSEFGVTALAMVNPLASETKAGAVAMGTFALWGMVAIAVSTAAPSRRLPRWVWRAVHASAFGTYLLALVHGLLAGTDTAHPLIRGAYLATSVVTVAALVQRLLAAWTTSGAGARPRKNQSDSTNQNRSSTRGSI